MAFTISDFCNVAARAQTLGLNVPEGIAFLPRNFIEATNPEELVHESTVQTLRSLFRQNAIPETRIEREGQRLPVIQENEFALVLPAIFVGTLILSQNPHLLSLALNVIANYATDFFRGIPGRKKVVLDVVVEEKSKGSFKKIHYEGEVGGLKEIRAMVGKVFTNEEPN